MQAEDRAVVMIISHDQFRDEELAEPKRILEEAGVIVTVASRSLGVATGMLGMRQEPDKTIDHIEPEAYDAVIFVGGAGANVYWDDAEAHEIACEMAECGKVVAAICIAPVTLARAGLLRGRKVAVFPSVKVEVEKEGGVATGCDVEIDGNIVTGSGPEAAAAFGKAVLKQIIRKGR